MNALSYLFPKIIERTSSPYNRDIRVVLEYGKYKLLVNGSRQSGEYIREVWQHAFAAFHIIPSPDVKRILVLGVAGGTVIHMLESVFPHAKIEGVDIDEVMVGIGKKYFGLATLPVTVMDAKRFIADTDKRWDIIVIDVFIGATIPAFVADPMFLRRIQAALLPGGRVLINYLYEFEYRSLSDMFADKLRGVFSDVRETKIANNRFFCVVK